MLQNLTSEQLDMIRAWVAAKEREYSQRLGASSVKPVADLLKDLSRAACSVEYAPTEMQMVEAIHQISAVLDRRGADKAAKKIRLAGNAIPLKN